MRMRGFKVGAEGWRGGSGCSSLDGHSEVQTVAICPVFAASSCILDKDGLFPVGTDAGNGEFCAHPSCKLEEIGAGFFREIYPVADVVGWRLPAWQFGVDGFAGGELGEVDRRRLQELSVEAVVGADANGVERIESV